MESKRALSFHLAEGAFAGALATIAMTTFQVRSKQSRSSEDPATVKIANSVYQMILFYGAAVWLFADEISLWLLGITKSPPNYPLDQHIYDLASHLVYGTALGLTMKAEIRFEKN